MSSKKNQKPQLHQSMLGTMAHCPIQFQRRYGARFGIWPEEEIIAPGIALGIGISVHKAVQNNLQWKIDTGKFLPLKEVKEIAACEFSGFWNGGVLLTEEEALNSERTRGEGTDMAVRLSSLHHHEIAPFLLPTAVEEKFLIRLDGYPFDLAGRIDIRETIEVPHEDILSHIRDTKTAGKSPTDTDIRSLQMAMYSLGHKVIHGKLPDMVFLDCLVKTKIPKAVTMSEVPSDAWIDPLYRRIERFAEVIDAVRSGKQCLTPADPNSWICTAKWCGYAETCEFWSGR